MKSAPRMLRQRLRAALIAFACFSMAGSAWPAHSRARRAASPATAPAEKPALTEKQLKDMARLLKDKNSAWAYARLGELAAQRNSGELGLRAALALGYYDYARNRNDAARRWLERAAADHLLRPYALFWAAEADRAAGRNAEALEHLDALHRGFPESVMGDQVLQALAETALALEKPQLALEALENSHFVDANPALLFLRGQAREKAAKKEAAALDYETVRDHFPLSQQAHEAGERIHVLERALGEKFPAPLLSEKFMRADALLEAKQWREAREEYLQLFSKLSAPELERAQLRVAQCRAALTGTAAPLADLTLTAPELDAERLYLLGQSYRAHKQEMEMLAALEKSALRAPESRWAEMSLFAEGNYFWMQLDRDRAGGFYRRLLEQFPEAKDAAAAHWRLAWTAYLEKRSEAASLFEEHLRRFPSSAFAADALYWQGRLAGRAGNFPLERGFYKKLTERFPQTFFGGLATERLRALSPGLSEQAAVLALIPAPPPVPDLDGPLPVEAQETVERANALRTIAFDASAEMELRASYAVSGARRLLFEAASAAIDAGHYGVAIVTMRQLYPQMESHRFDDVPDDAWRLAYSLPYLAEIKRSSARASLDPMLVVGLIRQESALAANARSGAGALGLMQLLPSTARKLSRKLKMRYSQARLFEPEYNLRLGTAYFAGLRAEFGSTEAALAAYNAGEDRVTAWQAGGKFEEAAEFVESIPFTETREYVEIVIRNAAIYRALYGGKK